MQSYRGFVQRLVATFYTDPLKCADMRRVIQGFTHFTCHQTRAIHAFTSQPQSITILWPVIIAEGWPGWVDMGGWLARDKFFNRESNPDAVTHLSTNRGRRRATFLIWPVTNVATNYAKPPPVLKMFCHNTRVSQTDRQQIKTCNDNGRMFHCNVAKNETAYRVARNLALSDLT